LILGAHFYPRLSLYLSLRVYYTLRGVQSFL
jgi:hypothetical protein